MIPEVDAILKQIERLPCVNWCANYIEISGPRRQDGTNSHMDFQDGFLETLAPLGKWD